MRARDTRLGRPVVLKCLAPKLVPDAAALQRLLRGVRAACALNHPDIVTVHDLGAECVSCKASLDRRHPSR